MSEFEFVNETEALAIYEEPKRLDAIIKKTREGALSVVPDVSTKKGRDEIRSRAFAVAKVRTMIVKQAAPKKAGHQQKIKEINTIVKRVEKELLEVQEEARKPLTEYEAEQERLDKLHKANVENIISLRQTRNENNEPFNSTTLKEKLALVKTYELTFESFGHRLAEAEFEHEATITALGKVIDEREKQEDTEKRLAELQAEKKVREKEDEERRKKEAAQKAEAERKEREAKIKADAEAAANIAAEKAIADAKAKAEEEKKAAAEKAKRDAKEAEEKRLADIQAEKDRAAAEKQALIDAQLERERREKADAAEAKAIEEARLKQEAEAERKRIANKKHRAAVDKNILLALDGIGIPQKLGKAFISAVLKRDIPHVRIDY